MPLKRPALLSQTSVSWFGDPSRAALAGSGRILISWSRRTQFGSDESVVFQSEACRRRSNTRAYQVVDAFLSRVKMPCAILSSRSNTQSPFFQAAARILISEQDDVVPATQERSSSRS
jgi:hypothetical protein